MTDLGLVVELTILVLSVFVGFEVISKVPTIHAAILARSRGIPAVSGVPCA